MNPLNVLTISFMTVMGVALFTLVYQQDTDPQLRCEQEGLEWFERVNYEGDEPKIIYQNCRILETP